MAKLPVDMRLKIEKKIEDGLIAQGFRPYLGMSGLGDPCARKLWYGFRLVKRSEITPRIKRLFQRGHREELIIQADFKKIGIICHVDQDNQPEVVHGNGHIKGHVDDVLTRVPDAMKTPHLGEYKTHNDKSFKGLLKSGVKSSKPVHYGQMQLYMRKMKLTRGLYVAVNKNDDARYYERLHCDKEYADDLLSKGVDIISAEFAPAREFSPTWWACKFCDFYQICHFGEEVLQHCRTCKYGDICDNGIWECSGHKIQLSFEQQQLGCHKYKMMEGL